MKIIDRLLNNTTMYRVVIYGLLAITINTFISSLAGAITYSAIELAISLAILLASALVGHIFFKELFRAPANIESTIITALILFLLLEPTLAVNGMIGLALGGLLAVASKYLLAIRKIHVFNPAAFSAYVVGASLLAPAFWWIGSPSLVPVTLIVGLLIARKIHRFDLFFSTILASSITAIIYGLTIDVGILEALRYHLLSGPAIFFAAVMVTEPLTSPPRRWQRIIYGASIGVISVLPIGRGILFTTPELTLLLANGAVFFLGLKRRLVIPLLEKKEVAKDVFEFTFKKPQGVTFTAGQYLEWVLPHTSADDRGIKRYFTIASSPTEDTIKLGVKIPEKPSSFKKHLANLKKGDVIFASQLAGDFILPKKEEHPLVFIAGGIGITPFRSMIKELIDTKQKKDITLFYTAKKEDEFAYTDLFEEAKSVGVTLVHVVTDKENTNWKGEKGFITEDMLGEYVKNMHACAYYISGPPPMVHAYKSLVLKQGVPRKKIHTDYFPGYA